MQSLKSSSFRIQSLSRGRVWPINCCRSWRHRFAISLVSSTAFAKWIYFHCSAQSFSQQLLLFSFLLHFQSQSQQQFSGVLTCHIDFIKFYQFIYLERSKMSSCRKNCFTNSITKTKFEVWVSGVPWFTHGYLTFLVLSKFFSNVLLMDTQEGAWTISFGWATILFT